MIAPGQADCMRDVLALLQIVLVLDSGAAEEDCRRHGEDAGAILANADLPGCLMAAVAMTAGAWRALAQVMADAGTGTEQDNLALLLAEGRQAAARPCGEPLT